MTSLNIVFAGTPAFGLPCLDALAHSQHVIKAVYTQPDRPAGRGRQLQASEVKQWAVAHDIPVYQPLHFKDAQTIEELAALQPDVLIVIAYGLILPRAVLQIPTKGCINVHASLLPRWRGASPIQQAIWHGDVETGVTIMQMDVGLDTGDMLAHTSCLIGHDTTAQLHDRLANLAIDPLLNTLNALDTIIPEPQNHQQATYAPKISKEDAKINWQQPAKAIERQIRALNPWPIAHTKAQEVTFRVMQARVIEEASEQPPGTILRLEKQGLFVATGEHILCIERLQWPGGKAMPVADWLHAGRQQLYPSLVLG